MAKEHQVNYKDAFSVETLSDSQVKITGELPYAELESERAAAVVALSKDVSIDGFRKGNIPEKVLEKHVGEMAILAEMAERAIRHSYGHILMAHEIDAIGQPSIELTKVAPQNPLGFTITVTVMPKIELPDYKKIAKEKNTDQPSSEVTDKEVEKQIQDILRQKAAYERLQNKAAAKADADSNDTDLPTPESEAAKAEDTTEETEAELEIPELTDEVAQSLGQPGQFESVADLKSKLREHLEIEKQREAAAKHRAAITDAIIEETKLELPQVMIDSELKQMQAQMQEDLDRAELKFDDYLSHINKTKEELMKEWEPAAIQRAKLQLILNEIAKAEELVPDSEKVNAQTKELMERFKDAEEQQVRLYVASVLMNEEVMKLLESQ